MKIHRVLMAIVFFSSLLLPACSNQDPREDIPGNVANDYSSTIPAIISLDPNPTSTPPFSAITTTPLPLTVPSISPTLFQTVTPISIQNPLPEEILDRYQMQQRVEDWITGKIILPQEDRILDENTGKELRLSMLGKPFWQAHIVAFNLGFMVVKDARNLEYLVNIVGLEKANGDRFTFAFHNGRLHGETGTIIVAKFTGRRVNYGTLITNQQLTPYDLTLVEDLTMKVNVVTTHYGDPDGGNIYHESYQDTFSELMDYLECENCEAQDLMIDMFIDSVPEFFDRKMPYIWRYSVSFPDT